MTETIHRKNNLHTLPYNPFAKGTSTYVYEANPRAKSKPNLHNDKLIHRNNQQEVNHMKKTTPTYSHAKIPGVIYSRASKEPSLDHQQHPER